MTTRRALELAPEEKWPGCSDNLSREQVPAAQDVATGGPSVIPHERRDTHVTHEQSPIATGIDAQVPNSMPRAEDDGITRAGSREFHDQPGSGGNTACRHVFF